jgi:hypothetical protein
MKIRPHESCGLHGIGHRTRTPASVVAPPPMTPEADRRATSTPTLVLEMHRSGTSLTARLLRDAGWFLGDDVDLLGPADGNPDGLF